MKISKSLDISCFCINSHLSFTTTIRGLTVRHRLSLTSREGPSHLLLPKQLLARMPFHVIVLLAQNDYLPSNFVVLEDRFFFFWERKLFLFFAKKKKNLQVQFFCICSFHPGTLPATHVHGWYLQLCLPSLQSKHFNAAPIYEWASLLELHVKCILLNRRSTVPNIPLPPPQNPSYMVGSDNGIVSLRAR